MRDLIDDSAPGLDALGGEGRAKIIADEVGQLIDAPPERLPVPGWKGDQAGLVGLREIVNVAAVVYRWRTRADVLEQLLEQRHAPRAGQPAHKDVLPRRTGLQPELKRFDRVLLSDDTDDRLQFGRGVEGKVARIASPAQRIDWQWGRTDRTCGTTLAYLRFIAHGESSLVSFSSRLRLSQSDNQDPPDISPI